MGGHFANTGSSVSFHQFSLKAGGRDSGAESRQATTLQNPSRKTTTGELCGQLQEVQSGEWAHTLGTYFELLKGVLSFRQAVTLGLAGLLPAPLEKVHVRPRGRVEGGVQHLSKDTAACRLLCRRSGRVPDLAHTLSEGMEQG